MDIPSLYKLYNQHFLVDTDTRSIRKNTLYFALKGANFDGNKFAEEALKKGALYSIIDDEQYYVDERTILVNDVLTKLQELAKYHRLQLGIPIISLTGSNGKTTTKELINAVLKTKYKTTATKGNLNNHIGVPLTLLSMTHETDIGIVEMGANHQKEIEFLCSITNPDYGYITNFGKAHLEGFGGIEGVIKGKSELYTHLKKNAKTVFVNPLDDKQVELTEHINRIFLNTNATLVDLDPFLKIKYNDTLFSTQLIGAYNYPNLLSALTIGEYFSVSSNNIIKALQNYTPNNNRSQIIESKNNSIILDAYNANPTSMKAALESFHKNSAKSKVAILGDMFELGEYAVKEHQNIVDLTSKLGIKTIFVGAYFYNTSAKLKFKNREDVMEYLNKNPLTNTTVLIKGSRGMALENLLEVI